MVARCHAPGLFGVCAPAFELPAQLDRTFVSAFNAFWWLTMYELASSLLYANLLNRLLGIFAR
jgi:hypothetical protein